jgi:hypothetical protein
MEAHGTDRPTEAFSNLRDRLVSGKIQECVVIFLQPWSGRWPMKRAVAIGFLRVLFCGRNCQRWRPSQNCQTRSCWNGRTSSIGCSRAWVKCFFFLSHVSCRLGQVKCPNAPGRSFVSEPQASQARGSGDSERAQIWRSRTSSRCSSASTAGSPSSFTRRARIRASSAIRLISCSSFRISASR